MKKIDKIVLVLLTLSLSILTEKLDLSVNDNKLLCTILWSAWLVSVAAYYFIITKDWRFEHSVHGGYVIGFAIHIEAVNDSKTLNIIIPFMVLEFKWTKLAILF